MRKPIRTFTVYRDPVPATASPATAAPAPAPPAPIPPAKAVTLFGEPGRPKTPVLAAELRARPVFFGDPVTPRGPDAVTVPATPRRPRGVPQVPGAPVKRTAKFAQPPATPRRPAREIVPPPKPSKRKADQVVPHLDEALQAMHGRKRLRLVPPPAPIVTAPVPAFAVVVPVRTGRRLARAS